MIRFFVILVRSFGDRNVYAINGLFGVCLLLGIGPCAITRRPRSVSWTLPGLDPILSYRLPGGLWVLHPDSPMLMVHCQDLKKVPQPRGLASWIDLPLPEGLPVPPILGASTVCRSTQPSASTVRPAAQRL